ncbi:anti-sigma factor domain-containing protein [Nocardia sp. NPDC127579]|uniref:anti-sigma factor n=1 Tax=Nocardia sp. NPDC127579 TaxID=3345402 RepID=UPI00364010CE
MKRESEHLNLLDLAYPYALDAVSDAERRAIEHCRERADRRTAVQFDATVAAVGETLARLTALDACAPPPELEERLQRALTRVTTGRGRRIGVQRLVAAVMLLVALAAGAGFLLLRAGAEPTPSVSTTAEIDARPDALTRTVWVGERGVLEIRSSESLRTAAVDFVGVRRPPSGRVYQLWLVPPTGAARSAAVVDRLPDAPLVIVFTTADTLAVTVEPAGGSPAPTMSPIAMLALCRGGS